MIKIPAQMTIPTNLKVPAGKKYFLDHIR